MLFYYLLFIPLLWITWALTFPLEALHQIAHWKYLFSKYIVQYMIRRETRLVKDQFWKWGKLNGYKPGLIEEVFESHMQQIFKRIENRYFVVNPEELLRDGD